MDASRPGAWEDRPVSVRRLPRRSLRRLAISAAALVVVALIAASPAAAAGPSVTMDQAAGQSDPAFAAPIEFTATFSEAVHGFDAADIDLSSSTAGGVLVATVTGGPAVYTVAVSGMTTAGSVIASIPAGAALNGASQQSAASTSTDNEVDWIVDSAPTVTIDAAPDQPSPASLAPVFFTVRFSKPVSGFGAAGVVLSGSTTGGALNASVAGGPTVYSVAVSGMTTAGTVVATIPAGAAVDSVGNPNPASTSTDNLVDWLPPAMSGGGSGATTSPPPTTSTPVASQPSPPAVCKVPKLTGKSLKAAKAKLKAADCALGKVTSRRGATAKPPKVTKQSPKPGKSLPARSAVKLTLG
jgi:hypothetical protein